MNVAMKSRSQITPARYAEFIRKLELADVALVSATADNISFPEPPTKAEVSVKLENKFENVEGGFIAFASYDIVVKALGTDRQMAKFAVVFALRYRSQMPMSQDVFTVFKQLNLQVNSWPYLREFIHSTSHRMNLPPLVLPTVKVGLLPPKPRGLVKKAPEKAGGANGGEGHMNPTEVEQK